MMLWLDDVRHPAKHGYAGAVWAKSYEEAIAAFLTGKITRCSLDHDLTIQQTLGHKDNEKTGYDVLLWLIDNPKYMPEHVTIHSANPVGRMRMENLLDDYRLGKRPYRP